MWESDACAGACGSTERPATQVLGENALMARVLLEGVGAFARALGGRYRERGRLTYAVLIPLLERLADPCPSVCAAAAAAIGSLCLHCGHSSFDALVGPAHPLRTLSAPSSGPALNAERRMGRRGGHRLLPVTLRCAMVMPWVAEVCHASQVRGNADYIVDGLCRQLRHLEDHPRCCD